MCPLDFDGKGSKSYTTLPETNRFKAFTKGTLVFQQSVFYKKIWEGIDMELWNDEFVDHTAFAVSFVTLLEEFLWLGILGTGTTGLSGQFPNRLIYKFIAVVKTPVQVDHFESISCRMFFHFVDIKW